MKSLNWKVKYKLKEEIFYTSILLVNLLRAKQKAKQAKGSSQYQLNSDFSTFDLYYYFMYVINIVWVLLK